MIHDSQKSVSAQTLAPPPLTETLEAVENFARFSKLTRTAAIALYCDRRRLPVARFYHLQALYLGGED